MSFLQAFLVGCIYWLGNCNIARAYFVFSKPLVCGFLVGLVFGDPLTGAIAGASINMIYLGWIGAGASMPADPCAAGTLGVAFMFAAGIDTEAAMVLAVPIGLLAIFVYTLMMSLMSVCPRISYKLVETGKSDKLWISAMALPLILSFVGYGIPCMLCAYFGSTLVEALAGVLMGKALSVITVIGGLLPAVGIAINLSFIFKGEAKVFLLVGYIAAAYLGMSLIGVALVGLVGAALYYVFGNKEHSCNSEIMPIE